MQIHSCGHQPACVAVFSLSPQRSPLPPAQRNSVRIELYAVTASFTELGPVLSMEGAQHTPSSLSRQTREQGRQCSTSGFGTEHAVARAVSVLRFDSSQKQISFFRYFLVCSAWLSCESLKQSGGLRSVWNREEKKRQPGNHSRVQYPVGILSGRSGDSWCSRQLHCYKHQ